MASNLADFSTGVASVVGTVEAATRTRQNNATNLAMISGDWMFLLEVKGQIIFLQVVSS